MTWPEAFTAVGGFWALAFFLREFVRIGMGDPK